MIGIRTANKSALFAGLFVLAVSALFVLGFAQTASAFDLTGNVVAVDHSGKILTLKECGTNDQLTFAWDDKASVTKDMKPMRFQDIKAGDQLSVSYYQESNGDYVAEDIAIAASPAKC